MAQQPSQRRQYWAQLAAGLNTSIRSSDHITGCANRPFAVRVGAGTGQDCAEPGAADIQARAGAGAVSPMAGTGAESAKAGIENFLGCYAGRDVRLRGHDVLTQP